MILILLRFSIRKVRILNLILFSILLLVSRILCVCSPLRLLRYYLVHLTLIPSAFLRGRPKSPTFQRNILQHYWIVLWDVVKELAKRAQYSATSEIFAAKIWPFSNLIQHHSTSCNMWQHFATGWSKVCNIAHNNIARCYVEMLRHVGVSYPLVWFSLRLLRFYMTQLILILALCHCYRTLVPCARLSSALVFRALWFNPTLIVNMYRTHFEFNSLLVSFVSFSSLRVKLVLRLLI